MDDSILNTIKRLLGLEEDYPAFDTDVIVNINTYLGVLNQLGVGKEGFAIEDDTATWADFLEDSPVPLAEAKTYVYLRVRQAFDPPASGVLMSAIDKQIEELGWRMTSKVECYVPPKEEVNP